MNTKVLLSALLISSSAFAQSQINVTKIGSGPNVFNSSKSCLNQITVNNKTNTVSFIHRTAISDNTTKGCLSIDVSNNGGETWSLNKAMNLGTVIEGLNGARYPQMCLTNSGQQYVLAPSLSNNGWEGFYSGTVNEKAIQHNKTSNLFNLPASFISSDENTFWATDLIVNKESNSIGFKILKGNLQIQEINWENNLEYKVVNCLNENYLPHIEQASAIAFSKDGKIGYAVFLAHINNCDVKQPQLIVFKTSTAGLNWSAPEIIDLTKINTDAKTILSPAFELDAVVDADNRLHLFTALFNSDGSQYMNNFDKPFGLFDFVSSGNEWQAYKISDLQALRVYLGSGRTASQDNRLQLTQSEDRNVIGYSWVDSDTKIVGAGHNTIPNLFAKFIDFKNLTQSDVMNCTSDIKEFANQAFFPAVASTLLNSNDGSYELPVALTKLNPSLNEIDEVSYHYLKGIKPVMDKNFNPKNVSNQDVVAVTNFIYPNPAINMVNLNIKSDEILSVNFYDATGAIVKSLSTGNNNIDISNLPLGVYVVKTQTTKGLVESKFVKGN